MVNIDFIYSGVNAIYIHKIIVNCVYVRGSV